jgi:hypothetical protein
MSLLQTDTSALEQPELMKRQISSNASNQTQNPTCWAFASSRVILKFIKSILPELQTLQTDNQACDKYYNFDKFNANLTNKNRLFFKQNQIPDFFKRITSRKCGEKEYKNLCLFMFIYYQLTNKFGCDDSGLATNSAMIWFTEEFLNKPMDSIDDATKNILPNPYSSVALELMTKFNNIEKPKIFVNLLSYELAWWNSIKTATQKQVMKFFSNGVEPYIYNDYDSIFFFNIVKNVIDQNLYVAISLDLYGDGTKNFNNYLNNTPLPEYTGCSIAETYNETTKKYEINPNVAGNHAMTIVNYVDNQNSNDRAFVIKNSWGVNWGINGTITIPISELVKHCFLSVCYLSFTDIVAVVSKDKKEKDVQKIKDKADKEYLAELKKKHDAIIIEYDKKQAEDDRLEEIKRQSIIDQKNKGGSKKRKRKTIKKRKRNKTKRNKTKRNKTKK